MTYIITHRSTDSILMASDTRLNYHNDKEVNGKKFREIVAIADCIQKTFYIDEAQIGIQFLGIGYFTDGDDKYPLHHFIGELNNLSFTNVFEENCRCIYDFLKNISIEGDTGNFVKGVMAGFMNHRPYTCCYNTYNDNFQIKELGVGQFIDSEGSSVSISSATDRAQNEIVERIKNQSRVKWWSIGEEVDLLAINEEDASFIHKSPSAFTGNMTELLQKLRFSPESINGRVVSPPHREEYNL
jgi:hypothetical protein